MSLKLGITGGIGSGKSLISQIFASLGVPVYRSDDQAKKIMAEDPQVKEELISVFGSSVFDVNGVLDRKYLSTQVFENKPKLDQLNAIVHPAVIRHAREWGEAQTAPYSLKEAALLFESGSYKELNFKILVTAPLELRMERVIKRDQSDQQQVAGRMKNQLLDDEKIPLADFIIINDGLRPLIPQVWYIHQQLIVNG